MPSHENISALFSPKSVAVVGASRRNDKVGSIILGNLLQAGFTGKIFPVNPQTNSIRGLPALRKVSDIPPEHLPLDLAVLCLPADHVPDCMHELGALPTRAVVIIGSGFKEIGGQGAVLEEHIAELAIKHRMAMLGPNSLGLVNSSSRLNVSFAKGPTTAGGLGFFSQSGALCVSILDWAREQNFGFSSFVSLGNKALLDESDILAHLTEDPSTKIIVGYLESIENGPRFLCNAHLATRRKPVILLKAGRTEAGARAASSHTGALAGVDMAYETAFRQTGIIRANRMEDLFGMAQAFSSQPLPRGPGLAVVTNAGGLGIISTDACEQAGLSLASLSPATADALKNILPPHAPCHNPVNVVNDAPAERFADAFSAVLRDSSVHSVLILAAPTLRTAVEDIAEALVAVLNPERKTVFACLMGGPGIHEGRQTLADAGVPCYPFPEQAIDAIAAMYRQSQWKENPLPVEVGYRHDVGRARAVIDAARADGIFELTEMQAQEILHAYEVPRLETKLARTDEEAVRIARQAASPVALKIASPHILHKTDVQGVALHLDTPEKIRAAFLDITGRVRNLRKEAHIAGCMVQPMAPKNSREVIIGFKRDTRFGPMVIFGLGGIHVEAFSDVSCRLAPLSLDDVHDMVREIKAFPLLAGMRGEPSVRFTALEDILLIMSQLALDFPEIQEAECNPVLANDEGALVADIRVLLTRNSPPRHKTAEAL